MVEDKVCFKDGVLLVDLKTSCTEQDVMLIEKYLNCIHFSSVKKIVIQALDLQEYDSTVEAFLFYLISSKIVFSYGLSSFSSVTSTSSILLFETRKTSILNGVGKRINLCIASINICFLIG